ncbi:ABC transporter substrate-binding protein [Cohnella cholangitidis]|uniref:ABC transporter substrate-binding protein n=1 Tax=Cohnella cholangitidis TaxID=2598458 RepID=A0A7G5C442_9BACL|nr:ABC transporter substrate-binding protein [Cohnella cholangitidis]QMV43976.1 ABC transporter substrate-binding protein [Cohnella cholangitidis]
MKRTISLWVTCCLLVLLIGCNSNGGNQTDTTTQPETSTQPATSTQSEQTASNEINFDEDPYTIQVAYPVYGAVQPDLQKVVDKVNEIALKKINAKVEFKIVNVANMANTYSMAAASGENFDLIMLLPGNRYLTAYAGNKMIMPIDELLEKYGQDIKSNMADILKTANYQGKQYGIPAKEGDPLARGVVFRKEIVDKYSIDLSNVKTLSDLDPIFEKVHAAEPELQIVYPQGMAYHLLSFDDLGNGFGVLRNGGLDDLNVVNKFETDEWVSMVKKAREWYQKGFVNKDYVTSQERPTSLQDAGKLFAVPNVTYNTIWLNEKSTVKLVHLVPPIKSTETYQSFVWAVPSNSERPDKAIQFLNLLFQDPSVATLLKFGIEGEHYVKQDDGRIDTALGKQKFLQNWNIWGDYSKLPGVVDPNSTTTAEQIKAAVEEWSNWVQTSKAFGFIFNPEPVKTEIAALTAIYDQYVKLIEGGAVDPDKEVKKFNQKLYDAGLQKVMDEKQRQLDEWAKTQQ